MVRRLLIGDDDTEADVLHASAGADVAVVDECAGGGGAGADTTVAAWLECDDVGVSGEAAPESGLGLIGSGMKAIAAGGC